MMYVYYGVSTMVSCTHANRLTYIFIAQSTFAGNDNVEAKNEDEGEDGDVVVINIGAPVHCFIICEDLSKCRQPPCC